MEMFLTIFLFAARHSKIDGGIIPIIIAFGVGVIVLVVCAISNADKKAKLAKQQQAIDEYNATYYNRWHQLVAMTGQIQPVESDLLLAKGEECLRVENNVTLYEIRAVRHSSHTFGSIPLGKGVRVGQGYSVGESSDEWRPISQGTLYVTNKQVYFDGDKQDRKIPISKISTIKADWSLMEISSETRQKSMVFAGVNGNVCREIVLCASGQNVFG